MRTVYDEFNEIRRTTRFEVTVQHLALLKRFYITWDNCEYGAPQIDPKRPYGNSDVEQDIAEILGIPPAEWATGGDPEEGLLPDAEKAFARLHAETAIALQIALSTGTFAPGVYVRGEYGTNWELVPQVSMPVQGSRRGEVAGGMAARVSPKCTEFCRQGGSLGHAETNETRLTIMGTDLEAAGIPYLVETGDAMSERAIQRGMRYLYADGWGYHAIADFYGRPHEAVYQLLIRNFPEAFSEAGDE